MHLTPQLLLTLLPILHTTFAAPTEDCSTPPPIYADTNKPRLTADEVVTQWESMWAGNFSLLNDTVMPNVQIYQDRLSIGNTTAFVPVQNSIALLNFMMRGRQGYDEYRFVEDFYFSNGNGSMIAGRWHLDAVVGNTTAFPARQPGDRVRYNGTDILLLDDCSGRVQQSLTAQDLIDFYSQLGVPVST